jgi:hypothetical protein
MVENVKRMQISLTIFNDGSSLYSAFTLVEHYCGITFRVANTRDTIAKPKVVLNML